jgi:hypothetical protein
MTDRLRLLFVVVPFLLFATAARAVPIDPLFLLTQTATNCVTQGTGQPISPCPVFSGGSLQTTSSTYSINQSAPPNPISFPASISSLFFNAGANSVVLTANVGRNSPTPTPPAFGSSCMSAGSDVCTWSVSISNVGGISNAAAFPTGTVIYNDTASDWQFNLNGMTYSGSFNTDSPAGGPCSLTGQCHFSGIITEVLPEPTTLALLGGSLLGLAAARRYRR